MSDEKQYTERDLILAKREAYVAGHSCATAPHCDVITRDTASREAAYRYPLPKVTRARVVKDSVGDKWSVVDGCFVCHDGETGENIFISSWCSPEFIRALADLLANPTEEVQE